jgi:hypothetical protein
MPHVHVCVEWHFSSTQAGHFGDSFHAKEVYARGTPWVDTKPLMCPDAVQFRLYFIFTCFE